MRIVDIDPFIEFFENGIENFRKQRNFVGVRIYQNLLDGLKELPVIKTEEDKNDCRKD